MCIHVENEELTHERHRVVESPIALRADLLEAGHRLPAAQADGDRLAHRSEPIALHVDCRAADQLIAGDRREVADGTLSGQTVIRAGHDGLPCQDGGQREGRGEEDDDCGKTPLVGVSCGHRTTNIAQKGERHKFVTAFLTDRLQITHTVTTSAPGGRSKVLG